MLLFIKIYSEKDNDKNIKNGFTPTVHQIAKELNIANHEAKAAIEQLKESGRIKITDIPRKTTIEFAD